MKQFKNITITTIMLISLLLTSCEDFFIKTVEFDPEIVEPMLVLNSILENDSTIEAHVSKSKFILNETYEIEIISNATLKLYEDGNFVENLVYTGNGFYKSTAVPKIGSSYKIEAMSPNFEDVYAETIIPNSVEILKIDTLTVFDSWGGQSMQFTVKFKDPESEVNYYRISASVSYSIDYGDYSEHYNEPLYINSDDPLLNPNVGGNDIFDFGSGSTDMFTDDLINGIEYDLKFYTYFYFFYDYYYEYQPNDLKIIIELHSLSKESYLYHASVNLQGNSEDNPFMEPTPIYNNIVNGIGIWAGESIFKKEFIY